MSDPLLHFIMELPREATSKFLTGKLFYRNSTGYTVQWKVSTSYTGVQVFGSYAQKHHPIPPGEYTVRTTPFDERKVPGIMGNAYYIEPDPCPAPYGKRGELLIHFDAPPQGSWGCPIFQTKKEWAAFEAAMKALHDAGISRVKFLVDYLLKK